MTTPYTQKNTYARFNPDIKNLYSPKTERAERDAFLNNLKEAALNEILNAKVGYHIYYLKFSFEHETYCLSSYIRKRDEQLIISIEPIGEQSSNIIITEPQHANAIAYFTRLREQDKNKKKNYTRKQSSYLTEEDKNLTSVPYAELHA